MTIKARIQKFWKGTSIWFKGLIGLMAFAITTVLAYEAGAKQSQSLLIDTMAKYREFYDEIREDPKSACDQNGQLQGLYLSQFNSMLPVIEGAVSAPYDNPCPPRSPPRPPRGLDISFCQRWETWNDFLLDPQPSMSIEIEGAALSYPLDKEWRNSIIQWRKQLQDLKTKSCLIPDQCQFQFVPGPSP